MSNPVAEQLATLRSALEAAGWERTSAGRWRLNVWELRTAYVWGEATLELVRSERDSRTSSPSTVRRYYRGALPLHWAHTQAHPVVRKIFDKGLDRQPATP